MAQSYNSRGGRSGAVTREERAVVLRLISVGLTREVIAERSGLSITTVFRIVREAGGVPTRRRNRNPRNLSPHEREEIYAGILGGESNRAIGARLARHHTTVGREIEKNGGRSCYRPFAAERRAEEQASRPKSFKVEANDQLCEQLQAGLTQKWSPQQISGRLRQDYPDNPEMWMSHEAIYRTLYVQGRGQLRKELTVCLRSGRAHRRPHNRVASLKKAGKIPGMVNISQRPAEAEDRSVPGHWEGDLIMGSTASNSAIATLVERSSRFVMLIALGKDHTAENVRDQLTKLILTLPLQLRRSLTWDQGKELSRHTRITFDTGLAIFFCDPHSPWQRGSNENTNGLLRQYLPKGTDLSVYTQEDLDIIAAELNGRPRQTLGFAKPCEKLMELLMVQ